MIRRAVILFALLAATARANVYVVTNDLLNVPTVPASITASEAVRVTVYALQGTNTQPLTGYGIIGRVYDARDGYNAANYAGTLLDATGGVALVNISAGLAAGSWQLRVRATNSVQDLLLAAYDFTAAEAGGGDVSLSLVPLIASNGAIGTAQYPWAEINASTGTFGTLNISNLNVGGTISAIDATKMPLAGGTFSGPVTGTTFAGIFAGDGAGLTNLPVTADGGATNITINGDAGGYDSSTRTLAGTVTVASAADIYSTSNNAFGSAGSPRTNTFHGRIIAHDPGNVAGAPVAIELDTSNDVGLVLSSVDNGANADGTTIAPKMEIVSYAGGGYATMRRASNAVVGAGSWPAITMVQFASTPWMQFGFVSDAGGTVSNVVDIYGTTLELNPQSRTNVNVDIFGKTGLWARITGHEQFGLGTLQPQAGLHVSNRTLRVDGRFVLGGNSGRNQLTAGVCNIVLPYRMVDTNYTVQLSGETDWDSPVREWANGKTISNFVANGTTSNWFAWEVKGYTL